MSDLMIYGEIGWEVSSRDIVDQIRAAAPGPLSVRINTPGGSVFEGLAIATHIRARGDVTTYIDGIAASMGSIIYLSGSKRVMAPGTYLMIHDPSSGAWGKADDLRKEATLLDTIADQMAEMYADFSGGKVDAKKARAMMDEETWLTPEQAVELGWCDEIAGQATAHARLTKRTMYRHAPEEIKMSDTPKEPGLFAQIVAKISGDDTAKMRADLQTLTASLLDAGNHVVALQAERASMIEAHASAVSTMQAEHTAKLEAIATEHAATIDDRVRKAVSEVMSGSAPQPLSHMEPDPRRSVLEEYKRLEQEGTSAERYAYYEANKAEIDSARKSGKE